jgi:hypothetical protein
LREFRWHPAGQRVGDLLPHLILVGKSLDTHLRVTRGGCAGAQKRARIAAMVAAEEARNCKIVKTPLSPL